MCCNGSKPSTATFASATPCSSSIRSSMPGCRAVVCRNCCIPIRPWTAAKYSCCASSMKYANKPCARQSRSGCWMQPTRRNSIIWKSWGATCSISPRKRITSPICPPSRTMPMSDWPLSLIATFRPNAIRRMPFSSPPSPASQRYRPLAKCPQALQANASTIDKHWSNMH